MATGSETTGTALSGILENALQSPKIMGNVEEIRLSFPFAFDICVNQVSNLPKLTVSIVSPSRSWSASCGPGSWC